MEHDSSEMFHEFPGKCPWQKTFRETADSKLVYLPQKVFDTGYFLKVSS